MSIAKKKVVNFGELSHKYYLVLSFCMWFLLKHQMYPTNKEIDEACFMGGSPAQALRRLKALGYLHTTGRKRGMHFLDKAYAKLDEDEINKIWDKWKKVKDVPDELLQWIVDNKVNLKNRRKGSLF